MRRIIATIASVWFDKVRPIFGKLAYALVILGVVVLMGLLLLLLEAVHEVSAMWSGFPSAEARAEATAKASHGRAVDPAMPSVQQPVPISQGHGLLLATMPACGGSEATTGTPPEARLLYPVRGGVLPLRNVRTLPRFISSLADQEEAADEYSQRGPRPTSNQPHADGPGDAGRDAAIRRDRHRRPPR